MKQGEWNPTRTEFVIVLHELQDTNPLPADLQEHVMCYLLPERAWSMHINLQLELMGVLLSTIAKLDAGQFVNHVKGTHGNLSKHTYKIP